MKRSKGDRLAVTALAVAGVLLVSGCGRSEYESRLDRNLGSLRAAALFADVYEAPITLPGTPVTVRLPKFIDSSAKAYADQGGGQGAGDALRVQPSFLKLPGLRVTYEVPETDPETNQSVLDYCYLAVVPAAEAVVDGKPLEAYVQESLTAAFPRSDSPPKWSEVVCPNPKGTKQAWQLIGANGPHQFANAGGVAGTAPGEFRLFTTEIDGWRVMIGWWFHVGTFGKRKIEDLAKVVAGTTAVQAGEGAAPGGQ